MLCSKVIVVVTSFRCGTFRTVTGSEASSVPASIGKAAFFAPEIAISPSRRTPPSISNLSISEPQSALSSCHSRLV
jgi:hypothetical protein